MKRLVYTPDDFGNEVAAPSGYYVPIEEAVLDHNGKRVLYVLGMACIDVSCCGVGNWSYLRVEGYICENDSSRMRSERVQLEIETIEDEVEKTAISKLLLDRHPSARIEFR